MSVSLVQRVLDLRYGPLVRYAHGLVMSTATDARSLATACVLVRRAAVWPVRATDEDEVYRVLRRRVLRRALRVRPQPWSALSRRARVEPEPGADRELLRDAGPECRAILLLHLIDDLSIDDAEKLVASLARRGRDVGAAAAEARRRLDNHSASTVDDEPVAARLRGPSIRHTRARWLSAGVAALAVAVGAGVLVIPGPPPDLEYEVRANSASRAFCQLQWPARGEAVVRDAPLAEPLVRRAVEDWWEHSKLFLVDEGTELQSWRGRGVPEVAVLFAGRTSKDERVVLLCQEDRLARYVEPTGADPYPHLSTTTLPDLLTTLDGDLDQRLPFVDLGAAWLVDPDATRVRATPAGVPSPQWTDVPVDRRGVTEDVTTEAPEDDDTFGAPTVVRVDLPRSPRVLKPSGFGKSPTSVSAVHPGEQQGDGGEPMTLLPSTTWDTVASAADFRALSGYAGYVCGGQLDILDIEHGAYLEIHSLDVVASVPLPGQGTQVAFQAFVEEHNPNDGPRRAEHQRGVTTTYGADVLRDPGAPETDDPPTDAVTAWTRGPDGHWYYVAAGGADTARIQVTGAVSGTTAGRVLVLRGPKASEREYIPELPVAVALYDKRGTIIEAG
jgi:hypothetical protein